jgi:hypothetical protein
LQELPCTARHLASLENPNHTHREDIVLVGLLPSNRMALTQTHVPHAVSLGTELNGSGPMVRRGQGTYAKPMYTATAVCIRRPGRLDQSLDD